MQPESSTARLIGENSGYDLTYTLILIIESLHICDCGENNLD